jgi:hypothetical protein
MYTFGYDVAVFKTLSLSDKKNKISAQINSSPIFWIVLQNLRLKIERFRILY